MLIAPQAPRKALGRAMAEILRRLAASTAGLTAAEVADVFTYSSAQARRSAASASLKRLRAHGLAESAGSQPRTWMITELGRQRPEVSG